RGFPLAPFLSALHPLAAADPLCLVGEVAFLGLCALQSSSAQERTSLLSLVEGALGALSQGRCRREATSHHLWGGLAWWSLSALVYPVVSLSVAGNKAANGLLPLLESALARDLFKDPTRGGVGAERCGGGNNHEACNNLRTDLWACTSLALALRRLCSLEDNPEALEGASRGLERRARQAKRVREEAGSSSGPSKAEARLLEAGLCAISPLLHHPLTQVQGAACDAVAMVAQAEPALGVRIVPFILHALKRRGAAGDARAAGRLLWVLPELGRHKVAVRSAAAAIHGLACAPQGVVRATGLRLAAALWGVNSRYEVLSGDWLPARHVTESDEVRLARAASMLDVCLLDPELGLELVRPLQSLLSDRLPAVVALALQGIAALCRGDCLDFSAALRIVTKKGRVSHTGPLGHPLVMGALATLCGAGAQSSAASGEVSSGDDEESEGGKDEDTWAMGPALELLLGPGMCGHPAPSVRSAAFRALAAHVPGLLVAEASEEGGGSESTATRVAQSLRTFLAGALTSEVSPEVEPALQAAARAVLEVECQDPLSWAPTAGRGQGARGGSDWRAREGGKPSRRLLTALPTPASALQAFQQDISPCPGLAGAVLWSHDYGAAAPAVGVRDSMLQDLRELLMEEDPGYWPGACPWQRLIMPLGLQGYVASLVGVFIAAEKGKTATTTATVVGAGARAGGGAGGGGGGGGAAEAQVTGIQACRQAIKGLRGVSPALVDLSLSCLTSCVSPAFAHIASEEMERMMARSWKAGLGGAGGLGSGRGAGTAPEGLNLLSIALSARALPESGAVAVSETMYALMAASKSATGAVVAAGVATAAAGAEGDTATTWEAFWAAASVGVASEWAFRNPEAAGARALLSRAALHLLSELGAVVGSGHFSAVALRCLEGKEGESRSGLVKWDQIKLAGGGGNRTGDRARAGTGALGQPMAERLGGLGDPSTPEGLRCLGLHFGLKSVMPGLRAAGMHRELLQV
ncbi:unnamed protein product, partial [Discosporangium mesarthrocarpum]